MIYRLGRMRAEAEAGVVTFRADDTVLGAGTAWRVASALLDALSDLTGTTGTVDGVDVRGVCMFDHTDSDLVAGLDGDRLALIWRDARGEVIGRTDLELDDMPGLVAWLRPLAVRPA